MRKAKNNMRLIESDDFPFEFLSQLAERESWRKDIHRPIYHVHKWWAKRLGSIFRGILLGCALPSDAALLKEFYECHQFGLSVFDPFMGSGTTVGEAHKLGLTALGRDINPVAVEAVLTAFGPMDAERIQQAMDHLTVTVGKQIKTIYRAEDSRGRACDVLYFFWVMQSRCPHCQKHTDLFPSFVIARNAYPRRKPEVEIVCPQCGDIFRCQQLKTSITCNKCRYVFDPTVGSSGGAKAKCSHCSKDFTILAAMADLQGRPEFRLYGKLVLTSEGYKEYLPATHNDIAAYKLCSKMLLKEVEQGSIQLPKLSLQPGHNTNQAMSYGFKKWRDFFNDRQLLALGWLQKAILEIDDKPTREALLTLFSGTLEFNNLFTSYKGEGTGAVRHMFSHHILKPERTPIEANVWGTPKSSGGFSGLFRHRLLRAIDYRQSPTEVNGRNGTSRVSSLSFTGRIESEWPTSGEFISRGVYLSCGDSAITGLPSKCLNLVVTDPPFFNNVHYSELADFFFSWQQPGNNSPLSTRHADEVQDSDASCFSSKLCRVFKECHRVLREDGLLVFTYHHSRDEGWKSLAEAILAAGFRVINTHPVKAEMSVATPKSQAKEPIQFDIVIVCQKQTQSSTRDTNSPEQSLESAAAKLQRLSNAGFTLSLNDRKIVLYGQLLTALSSSSDISRLVDYVDAALAKPMPARQTLVTPTEPSLFD